MAPELAPHHESYGDRSGVTRMTDATQLHCPKGRTRDVFDSAASRMSQQHMHDHVRAAPDFDETQPQPARKEQVLRRLIDVQEQEKQFLCHEFHDGLIQYAVGAIMLLESLAEDDRSLSPEARDIVISAVACLRRGVEDGRRVIRGILPASLDDLGLKAAIEDLVAHMREAGFTIAAQLDPGIDTIPPDLQTTAYRVVQESLSNVRRHSGSSSVEVAVLRAGDAVELHVADQGCGFDPQTAGRKGFGLVGMAERVRLVGGECRIESRPGAGARIAVRLPLAGGDACEGTIARASARRPS